MNLNVKLSNAQQKFLNASTRARMYIGGIGSGKTYILSLSAILEALRNRRTAIISFSYRNLKDVISDTLIEICQDLNISFSFNKGEMNFYVDSTPILLRSCDNPDKLRGLNLDSFLLDEAREMTRETLDIMLGRIRRSESAWYGLVSTSRGRNWFYELIKNEKLENVFNSGYENNDNLTVVLQSTITAPFLPKSYIDDLLRQYTSNFARQELYGQIVDASGGIFNPQWFTKSRLDKPESGVRFWDLAVSVKTTADFSASCLLNKNDLGKYQIHDMKKVKLSYPELKELIINTAINDGDNIVIGLEEAGQQRAIIDDLRRSPKLSRFNIRTYRPTKDKIARAYPVASQAELGNILIDENFWNREFFDECGTFGADNTAHDDMVDALTGSYYLINQGATKKYTFTQMC